MVQSGPARGTAISLRHVAAVLFFSFSTAIMGDALSGLVASLMFLVAGPATFIGMTVMLGLSPLAWGRQRSEEGKKRL